MKVFRINYETVKGSYSAGVLADTKDKAIAFVQRNTNGFKNISTIGTGNDVHAIDDDIVDRAINQSSKITKYKEKIKKLNEYSQELEQELQDTRNELDAKQQQPTVSSKDLKEALKPGKDSEKIYLCPYCDHEAKTKKGVKQHITKQHKGE